MCFTKLIAALNRLAAAIEDSNGPAYIIKGGDLMFVVADSETPKKVHFGDVVVTDAKGATVDHDDLTFALKSTNTAAVTVGPDPDVADDKHYQITFGVPGVASLEGTITEKATGTLLATRGAQFTVNPGAGVAATGGDLTVEGLTEAPVAPAPVP